MWDRVKKWGIIAICLIIAYYMIQADPALPKQLFHTIFAEWLPGIGTSLGKAIKGF